MKIKVKKDIYLMHTLESREYMKKYDKLIRDKIPEIIESDGKEYEIEKMDDDEYRKYLQDKLLEETEEYIESGDKKELADVLEVIKSILDEEGMEFKELEEIRKEKAKERGRFEEKIKLLKVTNESTQ